MVLLLCGDGGVLRGLNRLGGVNTAQTQCFSEAYHLDFRLPTVLYCMQGKLPCSYMMS